MIDILGNEEIYEKVILKEIGKCKNFLWIATADIKDMHVEKKGKMVPFLEILSELITKGKMVRLIHAKEPGPQFRKDFDKYPALFDGLERMLCPRCHFKMIIVDGKCAFMGSANFTGAGLGAKSKDKRNFESGIFTNESYLVEKLMNQFDYLWMGKYCKTCKRKEYCPEYEHIMESTSN